MRNIQPIARSYRQRVGWSLKVDRRHLGAVWLWSHWSKAVIRNGGGRLFRAKMLSSKDINFVGYTYKNFEIVNDYQVPGMTELKKSSKPKKPSVKSIFEGEQETSGSPERTNKSESPERKDEDQPVQGSFMNLLPARQLK